ncbi:MAG: glycosyltransferase family 1 protein [Vicinamibacterales bacterium]
MTALRIGVDARELLGDSTGVGRYLAELLRRWAGRPDADRRHFILYAPEPLTLALPAHAVTVRVIGEGRGTWWEQTHLRRAVRTDRLDLFFAPAYTAPLGLGLPLALTIHDISFIAHPEWFRAGEGLRRRWLTRRGASLASVIFTDSQFSRSEIETHLRVDPGRIQVIPPGSPAPRPETETRGPREPLVLFVGSLFNRRRLPDLIAAFAVATRRRPDARLVIVGDNRTWPRQDLAAVAAAHAVTTRTDFRSYIPEAELASLYARASVFAFFSEYEGFGLTPLEAMAAGVVPVVLDTAVAREVYGDAAIYVAHGDIDGAARVIEQLLTEPAVGARVLERAPALLGRYSWADAATRTLAHLERIAGK